MEGNELWVQQVSSAPCTRADVVHLEDLLDTKLRQRQARETGICPVRRELYSQCFGKDKAKMLGVTGVTTATLMKETHYPIVLLLFYYLKMSWSDRWQSTVLRGVCCCCGLEMRLKWPSLPTRPCMKAALHLAWGRHCRMSRARLTWKKE